MPSLWVLRARLWWEGVFWVVPLSGVAAAHVLTLVAAWLDESVFVLGLEGLIGPGAALTLLAAIGGGMVTFTGFVFSVVLLMLQFGSSAYSPRTVSYFLRSRTLQWVLAVFLATIVFSFLSMLEVGAGDREDFVPLTSVALAVLLLLVSLAGFLALLHVVGNRVRVDAVVSDIGRRSRRALEARFFLPAGTKARLLDTPPEPDGEAAVMRFTGRSGQVVALDTRGLVRLARKRGCRLALTIRPGDAVSTGSPIAAISGGTMRDRSLSACLLVRVERSLRHDPLYALRLLTDISLRALSTAVNDPTTAVRSLDEVEGVLRSAAALPLGSVQLPAGSGSVLVPSPRWSDIVDLAFVEIVEAGASQPQVTRRLTALLDDLIADLPDDRHPPLVRHKRRIVERVAATHGGEELDQWLTGDRQGLGGTR